MKINDRHRHLASLVSGKTLQEDVEIDGVVYKISSLKNNDFTWIAEGIDKDDNPLLLIKKRKDRVVASGILAMSAVGEELIYKPDMFDLPEGNYKEVLKSNSDALNSYLNDCMVELVQVMNEKVVTLLYGRITDLNTKVEEAISEATPFLRAQGD